MRAVPQNGLTAAIQNQAVRADIRPLLRDKIVVPHQVLAVGRQARRHRPHREHPAVHPDHIVLPA